MSNNIYFKTLHFHVLLRQEKIYSADMLRRQQSDSGSVYSTRSQMSNNDQMYARFVHNSKNVSSVNRYMPKLIFS